MIGDSPMDSLEVADVIDWLAALPVHLVAEICDRLENQNQPAFQSKRGALRILVEDVRTAAGIDADRATRASETTTSEGVNITITEMDAILFVANDDHLSQHDTGEFGWRHTDADAWSRGLFTADIGSLAGSARALVLWLGCRAYAGMNITARTKHGDQAMKTTILFTMVELIGTSFVTVAGWCATRHWPIVPTLPSKLRLKNDLDSALLAAEITVRVIDHEWSNDGSVRIRVEAMPRPTERPAP